MAAWRAWTTCIYLAHMYFTRSAPSARGGDLLVLIPAFNEQGRVGKVIVDVADALPGADVLVVDDGSTDATAAEALDAGASVLRLPVNSGYGVALQTGYKFGVRAGYGTIGQIDGDGQHKAIYLARMLEALERDEADLIVGSRFLAKDGHYRPPPARALGIKLFARLASALTHERVSDPTSGFQMMRSRVARLFCSEVYPTDYPDADVLILLHRGGYRVRELPVLMEPSRGASMHSLHSGPYYVYKMLLSICLTLLRGGAKASAETAP
jgi:glycosyltransferase involved in cell wall biosynthesis